MSAIAKRGVPCHEGSCWPVLFGGLGHPDCSVPKSRRFQASTVGHGREIAGRTRKEQESAIFTGPEVQTISLRGRAFRPQRRNRTHESSSDLWDGSADISADKAPPGIAQRISIGRKA